MSDESASSPPSKGPDLTVEVGEQIVLRYEYYRDGWRMAWRAVFLLLILLAIALAVIASLALNRPQPLPFGVDPTGRIIQVTPLRQPFDAEAVRSWAGNAIPQLYALDFRNYRDQLNAKSRLFTKPGYTGYLQAIERFELIKDITANNYLVYATPRDAFSIVKEGVLDGIPYWEVKAPMVVTYDNGGAQINQTITVTAYILRVPETMNPGGLAIHAFGATRSR